MKFPFKMRLQMWLRRWRFRRAVRLVRKEDGIIVINTAWQAALDQLAELSEWADNVGLRKHVRSGHVARVENITRLLVVAAEAGDPALQLNGLQERYVNIRLRAMSKGKRAQLGYEAALQALETRIGKPVTRKPLKNPAVCSHHRRAGATGPNDTQSRCLDCNTVLPLQALPPKVDVSPEGVPA